MAARVAAAIVKRGTLPVVFCEEVMKKIQDIADEQEALTVAHTDHSVFRQEQDEQLLLWMNRYCTQGTHKVATVCYIPEDHNALRAT